MLIIFSLFACKENKFDSTFDKVIIYDYGYSYMGLTYEIPIKFYFGDKEIASFYLFGFDKYLESGTYNYTDSIVGTWHSFPQSRYSNNTFFKGRCKWGNNIITGGKVTVDRQENNYTFIVDVIDNTGEQRYGKFIGKTEKEDWYIKSEIGGIFCSATFWESWGQGQPTDENYIGVNMQMDAGDIYNHLRVSLGFLFEKKGDITGVYHINPNANGYISSAVDGVFMNFCEYKNYPVDGHSINYNKLKSGTIIISRINEKWQYRIDVDVVSKGGFEIKGCFNGGEIYLFDHTINW